MPKKIFPLLSVLALSSLAILFLITAESPDNQRLRESFSIDATYYPEEQYTEIIFADKTQKTSSVIMEILGMEESYQKTFDNYQFVEHVLFSEPPKYGWSIHPIVLKINHPDFGTIELKTEIHSVGESAPPVIFST